MMSLQKHPPSVNDDSLLSDARKIIQQARSRVQYAVNHAMVQTYWEIGRLIIEHEQKGASRAAYGEYTLEQLSSHLTADFGKGFDARNLRNMRAFYVCFPIWNAVRTELSWTHYRALIRVENEQARDWYLREAIEQGWSARALDRQINVLYYERLLRSNDRTAVQQEAKAKTTPFQQDAKEYLRDPYVLDFLNFTNTDYLEADLEKGLLLIICKRFYWSWAKALHLLPVNSVLAQTTKIFTSILCFIISSSNVFC